MLPVSLDCPFLIAPSVFSNVYLTNLWYRGKVPTDWNHAKVAPVSKKGINTIQ
jgi:hypothetical protein